MLKNLKIHYYYIWGIENMVIEGADFIFDVYFAFRGTERHFKSKKGVYLGPKMVKNLKIHEHVASYKCFVNLCRL